MAEHILLVGVEDVVDYLAGLRAGFVALCLLVVARQAIS